MKFKLYRASTYTGFSGDGQEVEVNSLEDLKRIQEENGDQLILDFDGEEPPSIMIYDAYIE